MFERERERERQTEREGGEMERTSLALLERVDGMTLPPGQSDGCFSPLPS